MTGPHPALLRLISGRDPGTIADEAAFLASVSEHRMVASVLSAHDAAVLELSPPAATALAIQNLAERQLHYRLWQALGEIQAVLGPLDVQVAVLKGIATEVRWYDEIGQRTCTDLDLLLAPGAVDEAAVVVAALDPGRGCSDAIDWLARRRLLQHVDLRVGPVPVDLHFDPLKIGLPTIQLDAIWRSTQVLATPHGAVRVLSPEAELVLLLLHLNKDGFALLGPFIDIRRLLERAPLDWDRLRRLVAAEGLDIPVWKSLAAVTDVLGIEVEAPRISGPRGRSWDRLWGGRAMLRGATHDRRLVPVQPFLALHATGRRRDNIRELRRRLVPHRQLLEVAGRLDVGHSYLRYAVRRGRRGLRQR